VIGGMSASVPVFAGMVNAAQPILGWAIIAGPGSYQSDAVPPGVTNTMLQQYASNIIAP